MRLNPTPARSFRFVSALMLLAAGTLVVVALNARIAVAATGGAASDQPPAAQAPLFAPQTYTVTTTADGGAGSLRKAIMDSEANPPGPNKIVFNIPGAGVHTIAPLTVLPGTSVPVTIDGYTQPGASPNTLAAGNNAVLLIELAGNNGSFLAAGLQLSGGGSSVRGLVINRFYGVGIQIDTKGGNVIGGNFIGTNVSGTLPLSNAFGIAIMGVSANTIGGPAPADRNLISGNAGDGVGIQGSLTYTNHQFVPITPTNNLVQGNYIGTNASGTAALGNGNNGVTIASGMSNTIGAPGAVSATVASIAGPGDTYVPGNLISGNGKHGIELYQYATATEAAHNSIGLGAGGDAVGNGGDGVHIEDSSYNMIGGVNGTTLGGPCSGDCNQIAYNGDYAINIVESSGRAINNSILSNSKHNNQKGGIAFNGSATPVANPGCASSSGPNEGINSPFVGSGNPPDIKNLVVVVRCKANTRYLVQLFRNNPCGLEDRTLVAAGTTVTRPDGGSEWTSNFLADYFPGSNCFTATITEITSGGQVATSGPSAVMTFGDTSKDSLPFTPSFLFLPLIRR